MSEISVSNGTSITAPAKPRVPFIRKHRDRLLSLLLLAVILGAWQLATSVGGVKPYILPPISEVASWLIRGFSLPYSNPGSLWYHTAVTAQ